MQRQVADEPGVVGGTDPDNRPDAERLAELVSQSAGHVVVVLGRRNSGKSEFVEKQLLPRLASSGSAAIYDCATGLPADAVERAHHLGTVVLDSFDRFLCLREGAHDPQFLALIDGAPATIVLVVNTEALSEIFKLRSLVPEVLDRLFELSEPGLTAELRAYHPAAGERLQWDRDVLAALEDQLTALPEATVTPALVAAIDGQFRRGLFDARSFLAKKDRGLQALLDAHLDGALASLAADEQDATFRTAAQGALKESALGRGRMPALQSLAARLDVPDDYMERCWDLLAGPDGVLKESPGEAVAFKPPQLSVVVEGWLEEDRGLRARAERQLADGIDAWHKLGTLLPPERFQEIHEQRRLLTTNPDQAAFLAVCAFRFDRPGETSAGDYWFRRIDDDDARLTTVLEALASPVEGVRRRAASMRFALDDPRVQDSLCRVALEDPSPVVRRAATDTLSATPNKGPVRAALEKSASEGTGDTRIHAIEALRIFQDDACAGTLRRIVETDSPVAERQAAIRALARTRSLSGVSALVQIGLRDKDQEDRDGACSALPGLGSEELTRSGLAAALEDWRAEQAQPAPPRRWKLLWQWPGVAAILVLGMLVHGFPLLFLRAWLAALGFFVAQVAIFLVTGVVGDRFPSAVGWAVLALLVNWGLSAAAGVWIGRRRGRGAGSFRRILTVGLLANTMLSLGLALHPAGHAVTGRRRQAWRVAGIEAVALVATVLALLLRNAFDPGIPRGFWEWLTLDLYYLYVVGGMVMSWAFAVVLLVNDERRARRGPWLSERHSKVLRALLAAEESAVALRDLLESTTPGEVAVARMLLGRFGDAIPGRALLATVRADASASRRTPVEVFRCLSRNKGRKGYETVVGDMCELAHSLGPEWQDRAVEVLGTHPTDASVECLKENSDSFTRRNQLRFWRASLVHVFRDWHPTAGIAVFGAVLLVSLLATDTARTTQNGGWQQIKELRRLSKSSPPVDLDAVRSLSATAEFLAKRYPKDSGGELVLVFDDLYRKEIDSLRSASPAGGSAAQCGELGEGGSVRSLAAGMTSSLGMLAASDLSDEDRGRLVPPALRGLAAAACLGSRVLRAEAWGALEFAAANGGGAEVRPELETLFDRFLAADYPDAHSMGRVAAMLTPMASGNEGARLALEKRAEPLGVLLRRARDPETRKQALDALAASRSDGGVRALKAFVLAGAAAPRPARMAAGRPVEPDASWAQAEERADAVDAIWVMGTPSSRNAIAELQAQAGQLPPEVQRRLDVNAPALVDRALEALDLEKLDQAGAWALEAVRADGRSAEARAALGLVLYRTDKLEASLEQFREAIRLSPSYGYANRMAAVILNRKNDKPGAQEALRKAIAVSPDEPSNYALVVQVYTDPASAVTELSRLRKQYPEVPAIYSQLAWVYHEKVATTDPAAFELAYEANSRLLEIQRARGDRAGVLETSMNLAECSLTTGRYGEVLKPSPYLLESAARSPDLQVTLLVLTLAAQVLSQQDAPALVTIDRLQRRCLELRRENTWQNWTYEGTLSYLERQVPATPRNLALLEVARGVNAMTIGNRKTDEAPPALEKDVLERLRAAIRGGSATERR